MAEGGISKDASSWGEFICGQDERVTLTAKPSPIGTFPYVSTSLHAGHLTLSTYVSLPTL
jgi:hypothetical protein